MTTEAPKTEDDRIEALEARVDALQRKLNAAVDRIEELENEQSSDVGLDDELVDRYDRKALKGFEPGQTVSLNSLQLGYRNAGVRNKNTVRERIEHITTTHLFEQTPSAGIWVYTPGGGDE